MLPQRRVHRRRAVEVDLPDVGPGHVLGALTAGDEDQQAGVPLAEVAGAFEPQLLAALEGHPGALGAALFAAGAHDRGDQAEGDGVVHALGWRVERVGGLALVEVVDQPAGEAAAGAGGDAARERAPRREVAVGGAGISGSAGAEVDALEGIPGDQHPAVAPVVDVDPTVVVADFAGAGEHDLAAVEQRHQGAVARAARDGAEGVETKLELAAGGAAIELVGADALLPVPLDEAGEVALPRAHRAVQPVGGGAWRGGGEELDPEDPQTVEVDDAPPAVPHPHAVVEVAGFEAVEVVEYGPTLESHPYLFAMRLDARDVTEARHERPAEVDRALPAGDLDPEDLDRAALLGQPLGLHVSGPGVLGLEAVEVVAPERLLTASPAQPPLVGGAVDGGDAAVEEARVGLRSRGRGGGRRRGGDRERGRRGGV